MTRSVYVTGIDRGDGRQVVELGFMELLTRQVDRVGVFRPLIHDDGPDRLFELLRARYRLTEGVPLLLFVGQMNFKKNLLRILEAARLLDAEGMPFRLLLCGKGPHAAEIAGLVQQMGLTPRVQLAGHIASTRELDGLYAMSRLLVFPSLYDNAPMVLREAAAMGTPAVVISGSNAAECVCGGVNGFACDDTAASLRDAMKSAILGEEMSRQLGEDARRTIAVPWEVLMTAVVRRYRWLLERDGTRKESM